MGLMQDQFIEKKGAEYSHFNNGKYGDYDHRELSQFLLTTNE
jgi:hypothetical protein